jgi:hypothetical protein
VAVICSDPSGSQVSQVAGGRWKGGKEDSGDF